MGEITTVGLDLAKNVFQVHARDGEGKVVIRRRLRRREVMPFFDQLPRCLVGLEACAPAHHWARAIAALAHTVKLMSPAYVKPYVKRGKTDAADAEAIYSEPLPSPNPRLAIRQCMRRPSTSPMTSAPPDLHRLSPLTTKSTSRLPHTEQTRRVPHSGSGSSTP
jgi:transposase